MSHLELVKQKELAVNNLISYLLDTPQVDCPVVHSFGPGIYIREAKFPADTFAIGHYHKQEHLNIFIKGKVMVFKDDGSTEIWSAPMMFTSGPGRKIGYIMEDMVWLNVYATEEKDVQKLEEMFLDKGEIWEEHLKGITIDTVKIKMDQDDYTNVLAEFGYTEEQVQNEILNTNVIEMPHGSWSFQLADSPIHGRGAFASANIASGMIIGPMRHKGYKTTLGRYVNHSMRPNAMMHKSDNGDIFLVSTRTIKGYSGGHVGEEITIDYRQALRLHQEGE